MLRLHESGGNVQDGDVRRLRIRSQASAYFKTVKVGQVQVEGNKIRELIRERQGFGAGARL
jgi:hypothetical protein